MRLPVVSRMLGTVLAGVVRIWFLTLRVTQVNAHFFLDALAQGQRPVVVLWHDEMFPIILTHARSNMVAVVSPSQDGELLAQVLKLLGLFTARGSSSGGGMRALVRTRQLMAERNAGAAFTVDGPRGPRHEVKPGALFLAAKTGSPIIPIRAVMPKAKVFHRAWDKFQVPLPFSRCQIIHGPPVYFGEPADDAARQQQCLELEKHLTALVP